MVSRGRFPLLLSSLVGGGTLYFLLTRFVFTQPGDSWNCAGCLNPIPKSLREHFIPKKIWQTWHTPALLFAEEDKARVRTWHEKNSSYQYELVTDSAAESYVRQHFAADSPIRDVFLNLTDAILRADFLRYLILLADGGIYAELDVECREPIDTWIPAPYAGRASVVLGIEADRKPVENDAKLYYGHREHIWGITNWTLMSKRGHPFLRFVVEAVAQNHLDVARKQGRIVSTMDLSYKEVVDATGPRAFY